MIWYHIFSELERCPYDNFDQPFTSFLSTIYNMTLEKEQKNAIIKIRVCLKVTLRHTPEYEV